MIAGRYRLIERIGEGGHGEVWSAEDLVLCERVAVKLLRRAAGVDSARIRREIAALRMLRLPGVVRLLDEGTDEDQPFLVMELVDGAPFPGLGAAPLGVDPGTTIEVDSLPPVRPRARSSPAWARASAPPAVAGAATEPSAAVAAIGPASAAALERTAVSDASALRGALVPRSRPGGAVADPRRSLDVSGTEANIAARSAAHDGHRWHALAERTVALLETLARVHAAGVVHRDLKPANILVSAEGRPTLLDFGVSYGHALGEGLTEAGTLLGTPAYLAPEQILGKAVDARTDLYAVGVILYRALTGRYPHEADDPQALLRARMLVRATPVEDLAPEVPAEIADLVNQLLARLPEERPRSAAEVLALLYRAPGAGGLGASGEPSSSIEPSSAAGPASAGAGAWWRGPLLPRLGGDGPIRALLDRARAGLPADVVGPPGSGRSRCLRDVAAALAHDGRATIWMRPSRRPFASLQPLVGPLEDLAARHLDEVTAHVDGAIRTALEAGAVLIADDVHRVDGWSAEALSRGRAWGAVLRALPCGEAGSLPDGRRPPDVVALEPLDEAALRALFAGPDRLFHLCEDAAGVLWVRSEGNPARIEAEVALWVRAGLARWDGPALALDRHALGRLGAGLSLAPAPRAASSPLHDAPHLDDLLLWLNLAGPSVELRRLAAVTSQPLWRLEAEVEELIRRGAVRRLPDGTLTPKFHSECNWTAARRRSAHRAIASILRLGEEGRLLHLLAADDGEAEEAALDGGADEVLRAAEEVRSQSGLRLRVDAPASKGAGRVSDAIAAEAIALARRRAVQGHLGPATAALSEGLMAVRRGRRDPAGDDEVGLLAEWVKVAFAEDTPQALDRVLYELCRAGVRGSLLVSLEGLVRAALARSSSAERALSMADALPAFADVELERRRHGVRVMAELRRSPDALDAVLASIAAWADAAADPLARASLAGWRGLLCYRRGQFEEAALLHAEAAEGEPWLTARAAAMLNGASALLEAFRHAEAAERAAAARDLAAGYRHPYYEGRAEWLLRAATYRRGVAGAPDLELVEAVARVGVVDLEALVCLTEAAVAWRAGAPEASALSMRAAQRWKRMGKRWGELLASALAAAARPSAPEAELRALAAEAAACPDPRLRLQVLGLLGRACPAVHASWRGALVALVDDIPASLRGLRMDLISAEEALSPV